MSSLSDQARIARASRAFRLSGRVIAAAHRELESHGEWLNRHRATWAEEVRNHRRLLNRKLAIRWLMRFLVGLFFVAPVAIARSLEARLKDKLARASPQPCGDAPTLSPRQTLQHRIRGLDGSPAGKMSAPSRLADPQAVGRSRRSSPRDDWSSRVFAAFVNMEKRTVTVFALCFVALLLVVDGTVRGMTSTPAAEALVTPGHKPLNPPINIARASVTVPKSPPKVKRPARASGFAVLDTAPAQEALRAPPMTIAEMMAMAKPASLPPVEVKAVAAPVAAAPVGGKRAAKAKSKRKVVVREPSPLPWWQQWSWIRVR